MSPYLASATVIVSGLSAMSMGDFDGSDRADLTQRGERKEYSLKVMDVLNIRILTHWIWQRPICDSVAFPRGVLQC